MDLRKFEQREQKEESTIEKEIEACQNTKISHIQYFKKKHPLAFDVDKGINKLIKVTDKKKVDEYTCRKCNKKLQLFNTYECRCGNNFCNKHRFSDQHNCEYDYKSEAKKLLEQANPKIVPKKI